ncbi:hypothetical protein GN244_ATG20702 [Phytophthora infestans]|uniref:Uncharacterized protein n=1 Tax=Phytophthora infestans TaxID=4787 RepID=A0A833SIT1_PHYIN|nr:hypothetical protein GN244_ATG20702 [Phytophthora infestans]
MNEHAPRRSCVFSAPGLALTGLYGVVHGSLQGILHAEQDQNISPPPTHTHALYTRQGETPERSSATKKKRAEHRKASDDSSGILLQHQPLALPDPADSVQLSVDAVVAIPAPLRPAPRPKRNAAQKQSRSTEAIAIASHGTPAKHCLPLQQQDSAYDNTEG